jgi:hypothetical protein
MGMLSRTACWKMPACDCAECHLQATQRPWDVARPCYFALYFIARLGVVVWAGTVSTCAYVWRYLWRRHFAVLQGLSRLSCTITCLRSLLVGLSRQAQCQPPCTFCALCWGCVRSLVSIRYTVGSCSCYQASSAPLHASRAAVASNMCSWDG